MFQNRWQANFVLWAKPDTTWFWSPVYFLAMSLVSVRPPHILCFLFLTFFLALCCLKVRTNQSGFESSWMPLPCQLSHHNPALFSLYSKMGSSKTLMSHLQRHFLRKFMDLISLYALERTSEVSDVLVQQITFMYKITLSHIWVSGSSPDYCMILIQLLTHLEVSRRWFRYLFSVTSMMEFLASGLTWPSLCCCWHLGSAQKNGRFLTCSCSFKWINL